MSTLLETSNHGSLGLQPSPLIVRCRNSESSTAIAQYDLVVIDVTQSSTEPGQGSAAIGSASNSKFANVVRSVAAAGATVKSSGLYGVAQEAIPVGATGNVLFAGITLCKAVSGTYTQGEVVGLVASSGAAASVARVSVTQPIAMVVATSGASATQATIMLEGSISYAVTAAS
jgi:hypothetical protein